MLNYIHLLKNSFLTGRGFQTFFKYFFRFIWLVQIFFRLLHRNQNKVKTKSSSKMQSTKTNSKRRSVSLTLEEKKALKNFVAKHNTIIEAAEAIGVHRNVLDRVLIVFSGAPTSIKLIRKAIAA